MSYLEFCEQASVMTPLLTFPMLAVIFLPAGGLTTWMGAIYLALSAVLHVYAYRRYRQWQADAVQSALRGETPMTPDRFWVRGPR